MRVQKVSRGGLASCLGLQYPRHTCCMSFALTQIWVYAVYIGPSSLQSQAHTPTPSVWLTFLTLRET